MSGLRRNGGLQSSGLPRSTSQIRSVGRVGKYRQQRRQQWVQDHPPDENGFYTCHICRKRVHISVMKLDHDLPKGSTPKAIAEADENLKPAHGPCNNQKGSTRLYD